MYSFLIYPALLLLILPWILSLRHIAHVVNGGKIFAKQFLFWGLFTFVVAVLIYLSLSFNRHADHFDIGGGLFLLICVVLFIFIGGMNTNSKLKDLRKKQQTNSDLLDN